MDRLNSLHVNARVDIASAVTESSELETRTERSRRISPAMAYYLGIAGFVCSSAAVIAVASLLALSIN